MNLRKIKNSLTYLLLVAIYFFFVNLEARKQHKLNIQINDIDKEKIRLINKSKVNKSKFKLRQEIPVIPYKN